MDNATKNICNRILIFLSISMYVLIGTKIHYKTIPFLLIEAGNSSKLLSVFEGQVWRLWTPVVIHFTFIHLAKNILALHFLGKFVENELGFKRYIILISVIATFSNVGQFFLGHSKWFGGLSGIVYGLIGYMLMRSKKILSYSFISNKILLSLLILEYMMCLFDVFGKTANWAHSVGFIVGVFLGKLENTSETFKKNRL